MKLYAQSKIYEDHSIILNVPDEMYCVIRLISLFAFILASIKFKTS